MDPDDLDVRRWRRQLRSGDPEAFASLYRVHVDRVHRVAASLCGDGHLAEDVTAETFLTAWRKRATIVDSSDALGPWLAAIATRQALNAVRSRRRQRSFVAQHGHRFDPHSPDIADGVSARLDDTAALARTHAALQRLEAKEVEVLVLCVWSEVSTRDAAAALGVAEGTVRSRLSRARRRLRDLAAEGSADPVDRGPRRYEPVAPPAGRAARPTA